MGFFNLVWAGYGLYMYVNEMSDECKDEDIGIMVFAWSLFLYCFIGFVCCCACCVFACMALALAGEETQQ